MFSLPLAIMPIACQLGLQFCPPPHPHLPVKKTYVEGEALAISITPPLKGEAQSKAGVMPVVSIKAFCYIKII
jgi:hypothetical protein